ncbi:MAG: hypothetical protein ACRC7N_17865 [Clostridium sp.]
MAHLKRRNGDTLYGFAALTYMVKRLNVENAAKIYTVSDNEKKDIVEEAIIFMDDKPIAHHFNIE